MKKLVEHKYCDKCHKETETNFCTFYAWYYDLCPECEKQLDKMKKEIEKYQDKIDEVVKDYGFGKHLPKWEENNNGNN